MKIPAHKSGESISGKRFELNQPWNEKPDSDLRPTKVRLTWDPGALIVNARMTDEEVMTKAVADNEKLWALGDVFEMFIMVEGRPDYVELHVVPNGKRMHLKLPSVNWKGSKKFEELLVSPVEFDATTRRTADGWEVEARVPAAVLGLEQFVPGQKLRLSFCRYDAAEGREPVLSTTAAHPVISFHRPDEWTVVELDR